MKKIVICIVLFFCVFAAQAQSTSAPAPAQQPADKTTDNQQNLADDYLSQIMGVALSATSNMKLFRFVYDWIGTPYRFGGDSKKGIDCSAFTKELYSEVFNLDIRRNSRAIFSMVTPVSKDDLREGDLVFFKIHSRHISHVGIYLGNGRFAHASLRGVAINSLDDPYYSRYFYKGGRLLSAYKEQLDSAPDDSNNDNN